MGRRLRLLTCGGTHDVIQRATRQQPHGIFLSDADRLLHVKCLGRNRLWLRFTGSPACVP